MIQLRYFPISLLLQAFIVTISPGDEPAAAGPSAPPQREEIRIFVRISKELFEELTQDVVHMTVPVQKCVEGMPLRGNITGTGHTSVHLEASSETADFLVRVTGNAVASGRADVGPAIAKMTSRARFITQKQIRFDGITFHAGKTSTKTRNNTTVDRICAKKKGPVGRLIEHVGRRMADKATPEINAAAEEAAREMLSQKCDDLAAELISELNQTTKFEETVDKYFPEAKSWKYHLATRPNCLLTGVGPPHASFPEFLNAEDDELEALMEMWLPLTPGQAAILELVGDLDIAHDLLSEFLSDEEAKEVAEDAKLVRRGEWSVIQIGLPKTETREPKKL